MSGEPMIFHDRTDGVYQTIFLEPGSDATFNTSLYGTVNAPGGSSVISTDSSNTGPRCILCTNDLNDGAYLTTRSFGTDIVSGGRVSFYFRLNALPTSDNSISGPRLLWLDGVSSSETAYVIRINTLGKLEVANFSDATGAITVLGTSGITVTTLAWHRLCFTWRITNRLINECRLYFDGTEEISLTNVDLLRNPQIRRLYYGMIGGGWSDGNEIRLDDLYVDNNDTLRDAGDVKVTAKRPASHYVNNFATAIGNNPSNRWENVDERPLNTANGWQENSGGPYPIDEAYGIESKDAGDVDLSAYSGNYPDINPMIGVRTSFTGGVNLYECGLIVGYSESTNEILGFFPWASLGATSGADVGNNDVFLWANSSTFNLDRQLTTTSGTFLRSSPVIPPQRPFRFYSLSNAAPFIFRTRD